MGKKGDLLRKQKAQKVLYHYTREQMEEHDKMVIRECIKRMEDKGKEIDRENRKKVAQVINEEWAEREKEFRDPDAENDFYTWMKYFLSVAVRIMVEDLKCPMPVKTITDTRTRVGRFVSAFLQTFEDITLDENKDIRVYAQETIDKYGIEFKFMTEAEE